MEESKTHAQWLKQHIDTQLAILNGRVLVYWDLVGKWEDCSILHDVCQKLQGINREMAKAIERKEE